MDILQAVILSIVEGITEFLPISSTGHLVLASDLLGIPQTEFVKSFEIFIQLGAILSVVVLYFKTYSRSIKAWRNIILAFVPTAILGLIFYSYIKEVLLGNVMITLAALFFGGLVLIFIEKVLPEPNKKLKSIEELSPKNALIIGLFQSISMIPGVSRAGATIIGGLILGVDRKTIVEFSFLLAVPTMMAATGLDLVRSNFSFSRDEWFLLFIGFVGSFITASVVIKWFIKYIQNHTFISFGIYRVLLSFVFWLGIVLQG